MDIRVLQLRHKAEGFFSFFFVETPEVTSWLKVQIGGQVLLEIKGL